MMEYLLKAGVRRRRVKLHTAVKERRILCVLLDGFGERWVELVQGSPWKELTVVSTDLRLCMAMLSLTVGTCNVLFDENCWWLNSARAVQWVRLLHAVACQCPAIITVISTI